MSYEHVLHSLKQRVPNVREMLLTMNVVGPSLITMFNTTNLKMVLSSVSVMRRTGQSLQAVAATGHLSDDFNAGEYVDDNGDTVAHIAIRTGNDLGYSPKWSNHILKMANKAGVTVRDEINRRDNERFISWCKRTAEVIVTREHGISRVSWCSFFFFFS